MYYVISVQKNNLRIKQWIDHYLRLGFDKILIADHGLLDVQRLIAKSYTQVKLLDATKSTGDVQSMWIRKMFSENIKIGDYCLVVDDDEYLTLFDTTTIQQFVRSLPDFDQCRFNWIMRGHLRSTESEATYYESFNSYFIKSLYRKKRNYDVSQMTPHINPDCDKLIYCNGTPLTPNNPTDEYYLSYDYSKAAIVHDYRDTIEDFVRKFERGYAHTSPDLTPWIQDLHNCTEYWTKILQSLANLDKLDTDSYYLDCLKKALHKSSIQVSKNKLSVAEINVLRCITMSFNRKLIIA